MRVDLGTVEKFQYFHWLIYQGYTGYKVVTDQLKLT